MSSDAVYVWSTKRSQGEICFLGSLKENYV